MKLKNIKLLDFTLRHFENKGSGTKVRKYTPEDFEEILNNIKLNLPSTKFVSGEYPFSKIIVMPNWAEVRTGSMKIDISNAQYLRSGYHARTEDELAVMTRWFELPNPVRPPLASYLIVIVYSMEQLNSEALAKWEVNDKRREKAGYSTEGCDLKPIPLEGDWGVVSIQGTMEGNCDPVPPITMMRNALGKEQGGNGESINEESYKKSVEFWNEHAMIK